MIKIEYLSQEEAVYDITVDKTHNFYANDMLVHNCQEIALTTTPFESIDDPNGEIALCMLGGVNMGIVDGPDTFWKFEQPLKYVVRALDKIIDLQEYPTIQSEHQIRRRSIGVGVTNFAYFLAKNGVKYTDKKALALVDEAFEHIQFYLLKASMELAKELGP